MKSTNLVLAAGVIVAAFVLLRKKIGGLSANGGAFLERAFEFLKPLEGFIPVSKWDYKQYSWGYGTKAPGGGLAITREQAKAEAIAYLADDLEWLQNTGIASKLNENQTIAVLSFMYNLGRGAFDGSTLRRRIEQGRYAEAANEFAKWNKAGGVVLPGLVTRRAAEAAKFRS